MIAIQDVNTLKEKTNLIDLASKFYVLNHSNEFSCMNCPICVNADHAYKSVSVTKTSFSCISCDVQGDAISFLMLCRKMSFKEAYDFLSTYIKSKEKEFNAKMEEDYNKHGLIGKMSFDHWPNVIVLKNGYHFVADEIKRSYNKYNVEWIEFASEGYDDVLECDKLDPKKLLPLSDFRRVAINANDISFIIETQS